MPLKSILSQINPAHTLTSYLFEIHFYINISIFQYPPMCHQSYLPFKFPPKILQELYIHLMNAICPANLIFLDMINSHMIHLYTLDLVLPKILIRPITEPSKLAQAVTILTSIREASLSKFRPGHWLYWLSPFVVFLSIYTLMPE